MRCYWRCKAQKHGQSQQEEMTMSHGLVRENLRSKVFIASAVALLAATGTAAAQVFDNPPGSIFQDQGALDDSGLAPFDYWAPRARAYAYTPGAYGAYAYARGPYAYARGPYAYAPGPYAYAPGSYAYLPWGSPVPYAPRSRY